MTDRRKGGGTYEPASNAPAAETAEDIDRSPPIGVFLSGESFFEAAQHLQRACEASELRLRFDMPVYSLYCHNAKRHWHPTSPFEASLRKPMIRFWP